MKVAEKTVTAVMPRLFAVKKRLGIKLITRKLARYVRVRVWVCACVRVMFASVHESLKFRMCVCS